MKISFPPTLFSKPFLYGILAVYMLGVAMCWDGRLACPTASKATCCKQVCPSAKKASCCKIPAKETEKAPTSKPPCGCHNCPAQFVFWQDNVVAYQIQIQKDSRLIGKAFQENQTATYIVANNQNELPNTFLPAVAGKDLLKRIGVWRV